MSTFYASTELNMSSTHIFRYHGYETGNDATGKADDVRANFIPRHKRVVRARLHQRVSRLAVTECVAPMRLADGNRGAEPRPSDKTRPWTALYPKPASSVPGRGRAEAAVNRNSRLKQQRARTASRSLLTRMKEQPRFAESGEVHQQVGQPIR